MNELRIFVTFRWAASENNVVGMMTSKDTLLDQMRVSIDEKVVKIEQISRI